MGWWLWGEEDGERRGRDNGDKTRLRMVSCLARPGQLHNPVSGQSHVQGPRGAWTGESQNAEGGPPPPVSTPRSNLALQLLESPAQSIGLGMETKTPRVKCLKDHAANKQRAGMKNNSKLLPSDYFVPGTGISHFCVLSYLSPSHPSSSYYSCCTDREAEVQTQ